MIISYIICFLIAALIGVFIGIRLPISRESAYLKEQNQKIAANEKTIFETDERIKLLQDQYQEVQLLITQKEAYKKSVTDSIEAARDQLDYLQRLIGTTDEAYKKQVASEKERLSEALENLQKENQSYLEQYSEELSEIIADYVATFQKKTSAAVEEYECYEGALAELRSSVDQAVEAARREEEKREEINFYRIKLSDRDIDEIEQLNDIVEHLRNPEPLNKVIWRVYYQNPTGDMINRVLGAGKKCGIYKITNLQNQMCYVGQSVDVATRWNQHIKRGLGAEPLTKNKLYPAMAQFRPENFTFELLEECPKEKLNEREKFWIDYFHGQDFGYNETSGG